MKYTYTFSAWPDEKWGFPQAMFDLFRLMRRRVAMVFTQEEWEAFRSSVGRWGMTLRGVTRVEYKEQEVVE